MICNNCRQEIPKGEEMNFRGKVFCEDCYVEALSIPKTCDVAAVYSARKTREAAGQKGTEGLTPLQKEIYEYVKEKGRVTPEALAEKFDTTLAEIQRQFATLRHCELLKGTKIDGVVYLEIMN